MSDRYKEIVRNAGGKGNYHFKRLLLIGLKEVCEEADRLRGELAEAKREWDALHRKYSAAYNVVATYTDEKPMLHDMVFPLLERLETQLADARSGVSDEQARRIVDRLLHCDDCEFSNDEYCKTCKRNLFDQIKQAAADATCTELTEQGQ